MSEPKPTQSSPVDPAAGRITSPELEIKDAPLIFGQIWNRLVQARGLESMVFPKEIMWLGGAPGCLQFAPPYRARHSRREAAPRLRCFTCSSICTIRALIWTPPDICCDRMAG